jgi:hypothetical protein
VTRLLRRVMYLFLGRAATCHLLGHAYYLVAGPGRHPMPRFTMLGFTMPGFTGEPQDVVLLQCSHCGRRAIGIGPIERSRVEP